MVRSCVVTLDKRAYASLSPGAMAYFHLDVPHGIGRGQSYATQGSNPRRTSRQGPRQACYSRVCASPWAGSTSGWSARAATLC